MNLNKLLKRSRLLLAIFVTLSATIPSSQAQVATAKKQDGKFFATVPITNESFASAPNVPGFMGNAELDVTWWWLFDQPVYYYTLRWTIRDSVKVELYGTLPVYLHRKDLRAHPDLLKRFDDLRPQNMEITFDVTLQQMPVSKGIGKFGTYFDKYGEFNYTKMVRNVELMIAKSGRDGENISPGSPEDDFSEFTEYAKKPGFLTSKEEVELRLKNTFINTGTIIFRNAHMSKLELANREIKSIYDTLRRRERGCRDYVDNPLVWTCREEEKNTQEDDFWRNGGESYGDPTPSQAPTESVDDFWSTGSAPKAKKEEKEPAVLTTDSFWSTGEKREKPEAGNDFWAGDTGEEEFEIKTIRGKTGVVSASGRTLIPFKNWAVKSFKGGIAEVEVVQRESKSCDVDVTPRKLTWSFEGKGWSYRVSASKTGYVGKDGEWLAPPQKTLRAKSYIRGRKHEPYMQMRERHYRENMPDEYQRYVRLHNREMKDCETEVNAKMRNFVNIYQRKGYKLIT